MSRVSGKPYFVYVLWSPAALRYYIGISENPAARLERHNQGKSFWTARYRPWQLVWTEQHPDYRAARQRACSVSQRRFPANPSLFSVRLISRYDNYTVGVSTLDCLPLIINQN
jgi:putative endonuclease